MSLPPRRPGPTSRSPSAASRSATRRPSASSPTAARNRTAAPARRAAIAWLSPLPPGSARRPAATRVSPGSGRRSSRNDRSTAALPTTKTGHDPPRAASYETGHAVRVDLVPPDAVALQPGSDDHPIGNRQDAADSVPRRAAADHDRQAGGALDRRQFLGGGGCRRCAGRSRSARRRRRIRPSRAISSIVRSATIAWAPCLTWTSAKTFEVLGPQPGAVAGHLRRVAPRRFPSFAT